MYSAFMRIILSFLALSKSFPVLRHVPIYTRHFPIWYSVCGTLSDTLTILFNFALTGT